jgi:hypothetical protein
MKRLVLSETDLNKSSSLAHDYDKEFTVKVGPTWSDQTRKLHYLGHTPISIMPGSWSDQQRYRKDCMYNGTVMPHAQPYKRLRDHTREPNKALWIIAPHCETTNQQACLSESTSELRSGSRAGKKGEGNTFHIPSLITALPNQGFNNRLFVRGSKTLRPT